MPDIHNKLLELRLQMDDETSDGASNWYAMVRLIDLLLEYHNDRRQDAAQPSASDARPRPA